MEMEMEVYLEMETPLRWVHVGRELALTLARRSRAGRNAAAAPKAKARIVSLNDIYQGQGRCTS